MIVNQDFINWLLAAHTPSIRYLTLRYLLMRPEDDPEIQLARHDMRNTGPIPIIFSGQSETGNWQVDYYTVCPKYTSTHWSLVLLDDLHADRSDMRLEKGVEHMLKSVEVKIERVLKKGERGSSCFWGNLIRYATRAGQSDDQRVGLIVRYLIQEALEGDWRCRVNNNLPCAWGAARALCGLAALPDTCRTTEVNTAISNGLSFLLETHNLVKPDYPPIDKVHPMWHRFNFPLFYQADVLFVLRVLMDLKVLGHPGAQPALKWLEARRGSNGRWRGASPFRRRTWELQLDREESDRWVSLHAAMVLQQASDGTQIAGRKEMEE